MAGVKRKRKGRGPWDLPEAPHTPSTDVLLDVHEASRLIAKLLRNSALRKQGGRGGVASAGAAAAAADNAEAIHSPPTPFFLNHLNSSFSSI